MPGSVQSATPAAVLPLSLSLAFAHSRQYPVSLNEFMDGTAQCRPEFFHLLEIAARRCQGDRVPHGRPKKRWASHT